MEALPEVASAALSDFAPFWSGTHPDPVAVESNPQSSDLRAQSVAVSERFFETLGVPLLAGEGFRRSDPETGEPLAIVSQSLARRFGGYRLIGGHISVGESAAYQRMKVAGIVGDVQLSLENPDETHPLAVYVNLWQHPDRQRYATLLTRSPGRAALQPAALRGIIQSRGREYVQHYVTVDEAKDQALIENRLLAWLSAAFGVLALSLAATGLFGLLSYHVAGRTREIGLRMALGAERRGIESLVLRQLLPVMAAGVTGGLGLTLLLGKVMSGLVFGVSVYDPRPLAASIAALTATAVLAAWIPARRASSVDPLTALRHE